MGELAIAISSAGRRIGLMQCFREACRGLGLDAKIHALDCSRTAPAFHLAERAWQVPRCTDPAFATTVLKICTREGAVLVVPTIDTELPVYAQVRHEFRANGVMAAVSSEQAVRICGDKSITYRWLREHGFPTVRQATPEEVTAAAQDRVFPLLVKPRYGSASMGVRRITSAAELEHLEGEENWIVQEIVTGQEYTIDVYVDRKGECRCAVPRARLEVRAGEVSKAVTVKDRRLMRLAKRIAEALPGAFGALNIQCFLDGSGEVRVIEINARFGGGYPLAHRAGATFTTWLIEEALGREPSASFDGWQDGLAMLRYDEAVYLPGADIREVSHEPACRGV